MRKLRIKRCVKKALKSRHKKFRKAAESIMSSFLHVKKGFFFVNSRDSKDCHNFSSFGEAIKEASSKDGRKIIFCNEKGKYHGL